MFEVTVTAYQRAAAIQITDIKHGIVGYIAIYIHLFTLVTTVTRGQNFFSYSGLMCLIILKTSFNYSKTKSKFILLTT